jgi:cytochrome c5
VKVWVVLVGCGVLLAACGESAPSKAPVDAAALKPADARLAELYEGACKACHVVPGSGAPIVHDAAAWAPRWKQGEPVLLDHVIQGYRAMPALGQCATCTPDDFKALIRFMADKDEAAR